LLGQDHVPYATCTHHIHTSVGQVIFNITHVLFAYVAPELIINDHQLGAKLSYKYIHVLLVASFHTRSAIRNLIYKSELLIHVASQYQDKLFHEYIAGNRDDHVLYSQLSHDSHARLSLISERIFTNHL
jgi:hypothetical protein